jgi:methyltransferase
VIPEARPLTRAPLLFQLAGQIARAVTVFRIDEVVVFDSNPAAENGGAGEGEESGARFLVRILEYLETPQYLRRRLFPMHKNLKFVVGCRTLFCLDIEDLGGANCCRVAIGMQGLLPPLDAPHHVRKHEWSVFREGETFVSFFFLWRQAEVNFHSENVLAP